MSSRQPEQSQASGFARIFRVVLVGLFLLILWPFLHAFVVAFDAGSFSAPMQNISPDHDKNGKRIDESAYKTMLGYDYAREHGIASHAECKGMGQVYQRAGCDRFVTEQKHIPEHVPQRDFGNGKSTAQCKAEVNAYYEPLIQDAREQGDDRAADVWTRRRWVPELKECENYDHIRIGKVIHEPAARLSDLLKKAEQGGAITEQERISVTRELAGVMAFPDCPEKEAYIRESERFFRVADGYLAPLDAAPPLALSCDEYRAKLRALAHARREAEAQQAQLKRPGGVIADGARWDALNKARIELLAERFRYVEGAKAADCGIVMPD